MRLPRPSDEWWRTRWPFWSWVLTAVAVGCQVWVLTIWDVPWWMAGAVGAAIFAHGFFAGRSNGYHAGLWDSRAISRDVVQAQMDEILTKATPREVFQAYTEMAQRRDRVN